MMCSTMRWRTLKCSNRPTKTPSTRQHYSSSSATINSSIRTVWRREPRQTLTLSILTATKVLGRSRREREHHPTFFALSTSSKTLSRAHRINFIALGKNATIIATLSYIWSFFNVIWNKTLIPWRRNVIQSPQQCPCQRRIQRKTTSVETSS